MSLKCRLALAMLFASSIVYPADSRRLTVGNGTVKFFVDTNVLSLSVEGHSNKMAADAMIDASGSELALKNVRAFVDPKTFATGIALRDRHMREKVFSLPDGTVPEVQFAGTQAACPKPQSGKESGCSISGQLTIRGAARPFTVELKIREDGGAYRVNAGGALKLSAFGIEPPCQLGACVKDDVKLTFEFGAKADGDGGGR
jgi:polyisoprenoid-binding protein YceI